AEDLYVLLLRNVRSWQEASTRIHKGTPYHMLGMAKVLQDQREAAHDYFVLAALEDALLGGSWQGGPAASMLGAQWNRDVEFDLVGQLAAKASEYSGEMEHVVVWNPELLLMADRPT